MTLVKKLLLGGVPTVAAGGTGIGIWISNSPKNEEVGENGQLKQSQNKPGEGKKPLPVVPSAGPAKVNGKPGVVATPKVTDPKDLIKEVGLNCGGMENGSECSILPAGLNVDKNGKKENLTLSGSNKGKIRLLLDTSRTGGFRFTVIQGSIRLNKGSETITLERYENYGLDEKGGKVYLKRIMTADEGKIKVLGLPDNCVLPTSSSQHKTCQIGQKQIQYIRFDGRQEGGAKSSDRLNLNIYKVSDTATFGGGYRFSFQPVAELNISNGNRVAKDVWWDFRLKDANADDLVLERVWGNEGELLKRVGLTCNGNTCEINNGSLKIKVGHSSLENEKKKVGGGIGTIGVEKNVSGYYEGLRFSVRGGGMEINNDHGSTSKMEELEVYHISKDDSNGSYYLTRKHDVREMVLSNLGLDKCTLPATGATTTCSIQNSGKVKEDLKKVKFYDGGERKIVNNGTLTITIKTTNDKSTYPFGFRFFLRPNGNMNIGSTTLKENTSYEFKIRKEYGTNRLQLERAWDENKIRGKVGITCTGGTCTFGDSSSVNVKIAGETMEEKNPSPGEHVGKLKLTKNVAGYNEGIKFEVVGGDITFIAGTLRMGEFDSYEIKEENNKWYFVQKSNFMDAKWTGLGIKSYNSACKTAFSSHCSIDDVSISSINFKERKIQGSKTTFSRSVTSLQMKLYRDGMYDFGIRVGLKVGGGSDKHVTVSCDNAENKELLKLTGGGGEVDFKIEKDGSSYRLARSTGSYYTNQSCSARG